MTILDVIYARLSEHDLDGFLSYFHDDFTYTDNGIKTTFNGPGELRPFMEVMFAALPDVRYELIRSFETDADCAGQAVMTGTFTHDLAGMKATGKPFTVPYCTIGRKVDGKISDLNDYWNLSDFLGG